MNLKWCDLASSQKNKIQIFQISVVEFLIFVTKIIIRKLEVKSQPAGWDALCFNSPSPLHQSNHSTVDERNKLGTRQLQLHP